MGNRLRQIAIVLLMVGVIGAGINTFFGYDTVTYITRTRIEGGLWMYKYDYSRYIQDLNLSFQDASVLQINIPTYTNDGAILKFLTNIYIMFMNIWVYPIRIGAYVARQLMQILGINVINTPQTSGLYWLTNLINTLLTLQIPLIN